MKRIYLLSASFVFVLAATDVCLAAETITITIRSLSFDPKQVEAHVGDTVVWTNNSLTNHTAVSDDDGKTFDTGELKPNETSTPVKLERQGEFGYHCKIHGRTMSGTIVVRPAATN